MGGGEIRFRKKMYNILIFTFILIHYIIETGKMNDPRNKYGIQFNLS